MNARAQWVRPDSVSSPFEFRMLDVLRDWRWVANKLHCHLVEDSGGLVAIDRRTGFYCAVVVFDSFTDAACCCHIAIDNPLVLRHRFLQIAARAVFVYRDLRVVISLTASDNTKALKFNRHAGWTEIYRVRDGVSPGVDAVVQEMRRENCPWLGEGR